MRSDERVKIEREVSEGFLKTVKPEKLNLLRVVNGWGEKTEVRVQVSAVKRKKPGETRLVPTRSPPMTSSISMTMQVYCSTKPPDGD